MPKKIAQLLINLAVIIVSTIFSFAILNLFFISIYNQDVFPRNLVRFGGTLQYSYYPKTYNFAKSKNWTAILGDSYAQGMGDAFQNGSYEYSTAHFLQEKTKESFLILGGSGFGSINAARELVSNYNSYRSSWVFPNLDKPKTILFFFYEGNDLNNNIAHMKAKIATGESIDQFATRMIEEPKNYWYGDEFFPLLRIIIRFLQFRWEEFIGNSAHPLNESETPNSLSISGVSVSVSTLQGAVAELTEEEIDRSLIVFFSSIKYLQNWSKKSRIVIVYLPSVVSSYIWNEPIEIQKYTSNEIRYITNNENELKSKKIINSIYEFCVSFSCSFINTTPAITELGKVKFIHGPNDWKHFNFDGYAAVGSEILKQIRAID